MSDKFHTVFGICRQRGGSKKKCYDKAVKATRSGSSRKRRKKACKYGQNKRTRKCLKCPRSCR